MKCKACGEELYPYKRQVQKGVEIFEDTTFKEIIDKGISYEDALFCNNKSCNDYTKYTDLSGNIIG